MWRRWAIVGLVGLALLQAWQAMLLSPVMRAPGVLVTAAPRQEATDAASPFALGQFTLKPLARFSFEARVLLVSRYRWDTESALAPYDLGIGWQRMSDTAVIEQLGLTQSSRFMFWRWRDVPPIPEAEITRSAANIHVIPANSVIERQLAQLRPGQIVNARGLLVEATRGDGWHWRSSLSREDSGNGACELMYLESIALQD